MDKLVLMLRVALKPGRREEFLAAWQEHLRPRLESNRAQELYLVALDLDDEDALHLVEVYADPSEAERNAAADWFAAYLREVEPLLARPPQLARGAPVWAKGYAL